MTIGCSHPPHVKRSGHPPNSSQGRSHSREQGMVLQHRPLDLTTGQGHSASASMTELLVGELTQTKRKIFMINLTIEETKMLIISLNERVEREDYMKRHQINGTPIQYKATELQEKLKYSIADTLKREEIEREKYRKENARNYIVHLATRSTVCEACGNSAIGEVGHTLISSKDHWEKTDCLRCIDVTEEDIIRLAKLYVEKGFFTAIPEPIITYHTGRNGKRIKTTREPRAWRWLEKLKDKNIVHAYEINSNPDAGNFDPIHLR